MIRYQELRERTAGWLPEYSFHVVRALMARQSCGDVLEIGVWRGQSAVALASCMRPGETLFLSDLFAAPRITSEETTVDTSQAQTWWDQNPPLDEFTVTALVEELTDVTPVCVRGPSSELSLPGPFRLVHVDGCHSYEACAHDCQYALEHLTSDGLLVVDDYEKPEYPGVRCAVDELDARLFYFDGAKAYLCAQ